MTVEEKRNALIKEGYLRAEKWSSRQVESTYKRNFEKSPVYMDFLKKLNEYRCLKADLKAITDDTAANRDIMGAVAGVYYCDTAAEEKEIRQKMSDLWDELECHPYLDTCAASVNIYHFLRG